jgi:hypothetical protein
MSDAPVVNGRTLDWRKSPDPRNDLSEHAVSSVLESVPRVERMWRSPVPRLDQGSEGACTAFSTTNDLIAWPVPVKVGDNPNKFAHELFAIVKRFDEWPGEDYDWSSVNGAMKAARALGYYQGWRWAKTVDDVINALILEGPVVFGIPWLDGMFQPRPSGLLEVTGDVAGGHAITATGYTPRAQGDFARQEGRIEVIRFRNSWGRWGRNGDCFMLLDDVARLLADGEAAAPYGRSATGKTTP